MKNDEGPHAGGGRPGAWRSGLLVVCLLAGAAPATAQGSRAAAAVAFTHGVLAYLEEDYGAAATWLEEAVAEDPAEGTYLHWLAAAYVRLGRGADAAARLAQSLAAERPPASGAARVRADLRAVRESLARGAAPPELPEPDVRLAARFPGPPRWDGQLGLAAAHDSNPGLVAENLGLFGLAGARGDSAALVDLRLDHRPVWDRGGWSLGLSVAGHGSFHQELDENDLALARAGLALGWGRDPSGFVAGALGGERLPPGGGPVVLVQAGALHARFGGEELVTIGEAGVTVLLREGRRTETRLTATGRRRDYTEAAGVLREEAEDEIAACVDQLVFLGRRDRSLRAGIEAGEVSSGPVQSASFTEVHAELVMAVSPRWTLSLFGARRDDRYDHRDSNLLDPGPPRDDATWRAAAALSWAAPGGVGWTLRGAHTRRDSNLELTAGTPLLDFERTVVSLGATWSF